MDFITILLCLYSSFIFWCENTYNPKIYKALIDGTNKTTFISERLVYPTSLQTDLTSQRLFWADMKKHSIESVNIVDGSARFVVMDKMDMMNLPFPSSIDVFEGFVYGLTKIGGNLFKVDKFGRQAHTVIKSEIPKTSQIRVFQEIRQLPTNAGVCIFLSRLK